MSKSVGQIIKELRENKGLTQQQLANLLGCAQTTVAGWEALPYRAPGKNFIAKVADILGVTVDYLLKQKKVASPQIPCYGELENEPFTWPQILLRGFINVAEDEYRVGRFAFKMLESYLEPFISKNDYCIFEKKMPQDRDIVVVRFPEEKNRSTIRMWRQANKNVALVITNPYDSRPLEFYRIHKKEDGRLLISWNQKKSMVVEGFLVGVKKKWGIFHQSFSSSQVDKGLSENKITF